jgi:hypothetical protein
LKVSEARNLGKNPPGAARAAFGAAAMSACGT